MNAEKHRLPVGADSMVRLGLRNGRFGLCVGFVSGLIIAVGAMFYIVWIVMAIVATIILAAGVFQRAASRELLFAVAHRRAEFVKAMVVGGLSASAAALAGAYAGAVAFRGILYGVWLLVRALS